MKSGADLVVSIHQNSYHEESVSGGQVFYYRDSAKGKALAEILQKRFSYVLGGTGTSETQMAIIIFFCMSKCPIVIVGAGF